MKRELKRFKICSGMFLICVLCMPVMAQVAESASPMTYGESINFLSHATAQGVLSFATVTFLCLTVYLGKKLLNDKDRMAEILSKNAESDAKLAESTVHFSRSLNHLAGVIKGCAGNKWEEPKTSELPPHA